MSSSKNVGLKERAKEFLSEQVYLPYVGPISLWIVFFVFAPLGVVLYFSFLNVGPFGQIVHTFTLEHYRLMLKPTYIKIFMRTFAFSFGTNIICLLIGYPLAYFIVRCGGKWKTFLMFLVIVPSWTCYLIRLYALKTLTGREGLVNDALLSLGLISSPLNILYTPFAVILGLVFGFLPFMVLPIYASLEGLDPSLLEASEDLGATPMRRFFTVTLPLTKGGILAGTILVFIPSLGEWLVPMLLGGAKVMMAGNLIEQQYIKLGSIPAGSSIAVALTTIVVLIIYLTVKMGGEEVLERMM